MWVPLAGLWFRGYGICYFIWKEIIFYAQTGPSKCWLSPHKLGISSRNNSCLDWINKAFMTREKLQLSHVMCDMNENMSRSTIVHYFDIRDDDAESSSIRSRHAICKRYGWRRRGNLSPAVAYTTWDFTWQGRKHNHKRFRRINLVSFTTLAFFLQLYGQEQLCIFRSSLFAILREGKRGYGSDNTSC